MIELLTEFWYVFFGLFILMVGGKTNYDDMVKRAKERASDIKYYGEPPNTACNKRSGGSHQWETGGWNSGIYHHGAVGRRGHRCYDCG